jgi:hypothetical protein
MTERLPITIEHSTELTSLLSQKFNSTLNKLEAQLNFQTMMANWYGDEYDVIAIALCLHTPNEFDTLRASNENKVNFLGFSDDVFSMASHDNSSNLTCHIAITKTELSLLIKQSKLQAPLLNAKLIKVLVLLAQQLNLPELSI